MNFLNNTFQRNLVILFLLILFSFFNLYSQEYKVRLGSVIPKDSPWEKGLNGYIDYVQTTTSRKIVFRTYLGGQLGGEVEMVKSIAMGTLHAGAFSTAAVAEALNIPELQIFELPFLFENDEEADYIMDKLMFEKMADVLEKKGLMLVMWGTNGWRNFGTINKPILHVNDFNGLKMRSQEADVYINFYKSIGATPIPIATPDVLMALKSNMVDGFDQTTVFSMAVGWVTAIKHFTISKHIYQPGCIVLSKKFYNELPPEMQKAILASDVKEKLAQESRSYVRSEDNELVNALKKDFNINVIELSLQTREELKKITLPVYQSLEAKLSVDLISEIQNQLKIYRDKKK